MEKEMEEDSDAFYVVRKGDVVGIYKNLSDCQAQVGSSVSDPSVSVYKGRCLQKETEKYIASRGLKDALYCMHAEDLKDDLFGTLVPCPFQMKNCRNTKSRGRGYAPAPPIAPPAQPIKFTIFCKKYIQLGGTTFSGSECIIEAQWWLKRLERIFTILEITDAQMRQLATLQLQEAAQDWWESVTAQTIEANITWQEFRDAFVAKWMSEAGKFQLYMEFMDLKQGDMTFADYERKFNELSEFGPSLIDTPLKKNEKFIFGARPKYYDRLISHVHGTFTNLMDMATRFENFSSKGKQGVQTPQPQGTSNNLKKRKSNFQQQKKCQDSHGIGYSSQRQPIDLSFITCFKCDQKGHYANNCPTNSGAAVPPAHMTRTNLCHICLQPDHFMKDCPTQQKGKTSGVFAMTYSIPPTANNPKQPLPFAADTACKNTAAQKRSNEMDAAEGSFMTHQPKQLKLQDYSVTVAQPISKKYMTCNLEFDGASKGNPGQAGAGAILRSPEGVVIARIREGLGIATNNVAEYRALILGMKYALQKGFKQIQVQGDSKLVCMQVQDLWQARNQNMAALCKEVKRLKQMFASFKINHVLREYNSDADAQANLAINLRDGEVYEECNDS